jgi:hypothetical protein
VAGINAQRAQLEPAERPELFRRALEAAAGVPGVASAVLSAVTPVSGSTWNNRIELPDGPPLSERERVTFINLVSGGWFGSRSSRPPGSSERLVRWPDGCRRVADRSRARVAGRVVESLTRSSLCWVRSAGLQACPRARKRA